MIKTLLHGMTGPLDGKTYPAGVMMPLGANDDQWIAAIASYVRNSFGNRALVRQRGGRGQGARGDRRAQDDVDARRTGGVGRRGCMVAQPTWKVTASHNAQAARRRADVHDVEHRRAAAARDVVPGGTAGRRPPGRDPVRVAGRAGRSRRRARRGGMRGGRAAGAPGTRAARRSAAPPPQPAAPPAFTPPPPPTPRGYKVEVSMDGTTWGTPVAEGEGAGPSTVIAVRAGAREVRADHADRHRGAAGELVDSEVEAVRSRLR